MVATLGPEAWPPPSLEEFAAAIDKPRHLHPLLRHQKDISGIGRSWVDEILWEACLSPFKKGAELDSDEVARLHAALHVLGDAIDHYEETIGPDLPDKIKVPLRIHKHEGEPCPRCGTTLEAVYFSEHQMNYCPHDQTGDRILKDRRLSKLLKFGWRSKVDSPYRAARARGSGSSSASTSPVPRRGIRGHAPKVAPDLPCDPRENLTEGELARAGG